MVARFHERGRRAGLRSAERGVGSRLLSAVLMPLMLVLGGYAGLCVDTDGGTSVFVASAPDAACGNCASRCADEAPVAPAPVDDDCCVDLKLGVSDPALHVGQRAGPCGQPVVAIPPSSRKLAQAWLASSCAQAPPVEPERSSAALASAGALALRL